MAVAGTSPHFKYIRALLPKSREKSIGSSNRAGYSISGQLAFFGFAEHDPSLENLIESWLPYWEISLSDDRFMVGLEMSRNSTM
jgi:hypothetical protein